MKSRFILLAMIFTVGGCSSSSSYDRYLSGEYKYNYPYKKNGNSVVYKKDSTNCKVESLNKVPPNIRSRQDPSYKTVETTFCSSSGFGSSSCSSFGGEERGGRIYTWDDNEELRDDVYNICMSDLGYTYENIPPCKKDTKVSDLHDLNGNLPEFSEKTCYLITPSNEMHIGNLE